MRVKALLNLGTRDYPDHPLVEGEVAEVPPEIGEKMIKARHAVQLPDYLDEDPNPRVSKVRAGKPEKPEPAAPATAEARQAATPKDFNKLDPR